MLGFTSLLADLRWITVFVPEYESTDDYISTK